MKQRYKYIFHTELPNELDIEPDELSSEYVALKFKWDKSCPRYKSNPNHHFHIKRGMIRDDRILEICEVMDFWFSTTPSKFVSPTGKQQTSSNTSIISGCSCIKAHAQNVSFKTSSSNEYPSSSKSTTLL